MDNCQHCKNALFNPLWGDYKCKLDGLYRYGEQTMPCADFKKGTPGTSKDVETEGTR